jgi:hypothetical protein
MGINIAPIIAGAILGALGAVPAPAGAVLYCGPFGCVSSPYFRPPIIQVPPPVVYQDSRPPPPYAPPQRRQPDRPRVDSTPPPPPPSRRAEALPPPKTAQELEIEGSIMDFCDAHPDEGFCTKLGSWLRAHPQANPRK